MGQYYLAIILAEKSDKEYIRTYIPPHMYNNGAKLMEHSYINNNFVRIVENLIGPKGMFYKCRLVWAGDYADNEPDSDKNLYSMCNEKDGFISNNEQVSYPYIVNHTKKMYVMKKGNIHPLPLLTAEGNGRGGGDYRESNNTLVGSWARDVISMENEVPDYTLLEYEFSE